MYCWVDHICYFLFEWATEWNHLSWRRGSFVGMDHDPNCEYLIVSAFNSRLWMVFRAG